MTNEQIQSIAINKFLYYSWNYVSVLYTYKSGRVVYVPEVILNAEWSCSVEHMIDKWKYATDTDDAHAYIPRFYGELDDTNRLAMLSWIMANYDSEHHFSFDK